MSSFTRKRSTMASMRVLPAQVQFRRLVEFVHFAVDARADEALRHQVLHQLDVFALAIVDDGRQQHQAGALGHREHLVDHLAHRLRLERRVVVGAARDAGARVQEAQVVVDLGHGADGRARVMRGGFLFDGYGRRQAVDVIDVGLLHHRQELARVGRQRLDIAALSFGVDGVERERGLAGARQPGEHDQFIARQAEIEIAQVVRSRPADIDGFHKWRRVCRPTC